MFLVLQLTLCSAAFDGNRPERQRSKGAVKRQLEHFVMLQLILLP